MFKNYELMLKMDSELFQLFFFECLPRIIAKKMQFDESEI